MKFFILADKIENPGHFQVQIISDFTPYITHSGIVFNWQKEIKNMLLLCKSLTHILCFKIFLN